MKDVARISIKYFKPQIIKVKGTEKIFWIDCLTGYQVPWKALYLQAFQQTVMLNQDIKPQLKKIEADLPKWIKSKDRRKNKLAYDFLSPRPKKSNGGKKK